VGDRRRRRRRRKVYSKLEEEEVLLTACNTWGVGWKVWAACAARNARGGETVHKGGGGRGGAVVGEEGGDEDEKVVVRAEGGIWLRTFECAPECIAFCH